MNDIEAYLRDTKEQLEQSPLYHDKDFPELAAIHDELEILEGKLAQPLHAAIIGEVKAGKSTLLNAFAGGPVSPTDTTETTACIWKIFYGPEEKGTVYYKDGRKESDSIDAVYQLLAAHRQDPAFVSQCDYVAVQKPLKGLRHIYLVDTPGLETITTLNEERTLHYFQSVDVVLWVFNGNYLGQADVNDDLRRLARMGKPIVAVINRIDQVDGDPDELVDYLDEQLGIYVQAIFPLSARKAYEGILAGDEGAVRRSGFTALYQYLDEHIERHAEAVQLDSIKKSAQALHDKLQLIHRQALEQIRMKLKTYLELDEQIQYNGRLMQQKAMSRARDWLQHEFLSDAEMALQNKVNDSSLFSSVSQASLHQELERFLSQERIQQEVSTFLEGLQLDIAKDWQGRLTGIDDELIRLYHDEALKNEKEIAQLQQTFSEESGMESMKNSVFAAGAAGGALSFYSAVLGPTASYVSIGSAVGSIMPPLLLAGAAIGLVAGYSKSKKMKSRQMNSVNDALDRIRRQVGQPLLSSLQDYLQRLCAETVDEAKKEFVEKNFGGRSVAELKDLVERLQAFTAADGTAVVRELPSSR